MFNWLKICGLAAFEEVSKGGAISSKKMARRGA